VKPSSSPAYNEFFKIKRGQKILFSGGPNEEPSGNMNSMTIYSPNDYIVEDSQQSLPGYVVKKISDFHQGIYSSGRTQFSTGEPYEGSLVEFHNLAVYSYVNASEGTVNLSDGFGNMISTSDMSVWFTLRSYKSPSSTFTPPPLGAHIDTIRGVITTQPDGSGRFVYRIAPLFPGDIVYGAPKFGMISGKVFDDFNRDSTFNTTEPGIVNWPVDISGKIQGTVFTDASGEFSVTGIDSGTYIITQGLLSGWTPTYPSQGSYIVTLGLNDTSTVNNFGNYFPWNVVSGKVFDDLNENGIQDSAEPGMNHWLVHCYGDFSDSAWTDSTGAYIFKRVDAGMTTVSLDLKPSWEQIVPQMGASYSFDIQTYSKTYTGFQFGVLLIPQRVKITITVHDSTAVNMRDVWWGERPGAHYGIWGVDSQATYIDFSEGEFEVPPPTPGLFDARFVDPHNSLLKFGYGSWTDMRGYFSSSQTDTFKLTFSPGYFFGGDYPMTIIWPKQLINSSFTGSVVMIDSLGGSVDMKLLDSIVVTNPAIRFMTIIASGPVMPAPSGVIVPKTRPLSFALEQNFPNPFNPVTTIQYELSKTSHVVLKVYDVLGREIITLVDQYQPPGNKSVTWNAGNVASGIYFYRLVAGNFVAVKKMAVVR
ncbi:MAG TPA: SdrD B-like domain-containing protein, partial [Bacteroidota bacterium]|nr:SdrD B-like domain-containing protein [Bacteroidota bacterium]